MDDLWIWIKVPLRAVYAAITALKDLAMLQHGKNLRAEADESDAHAESLRQALRKAERGDDPDPR